jgi:chromosome segregation ATPase
VVAHRSAAIISPALRGRDDHPQLPVSKDVIMQTVTETQLERRIDDFRADVDHRFEAVDKRFEGVDGRFDGIEGRLERIEDQMAAQRSETAASFQDLNARFDGFYRVLVGAAFSLVVALIGLIATQL